MSVSLFDASLIVLTGVVAGFLNVTSAGGSLLTLPLLIHLGVPPHVANATNRVAIFFQNLVSVGMYRKQGLLNVREAALPLVPVLAGAAVGAYAATVIDGEVFKKAIGVLLVLMIFGMVFKPEKWLEGKFSSRKGSLRFSEIFGYLLVGLHGGFIQAGIGVVALFMLVRVGGYGLKAANVIKVFLIFCYTLVALGIFLFEGLVDFKIGLILAFGSSAGGYLGAKISIKGGDRLVHRFLIVALIGLGLSMLGVFDLLAPLAAEVF